MLGSYLDRLRETAPLVHCITNYVTANDVANMLLACGASPILSDEPSDAAEVTVCTRGLCLNLGTMKSWSVDSMLAAGEEAARLGHPILLDPVGVGASSLRRTAAGLLLDRLPVACIRGNLSEIAVLAGLDVESRGVDTGRGGQSTETVCTLARELAKARGCVVALTGQTDVVTDGDRTYLIGNGCPEMGRVTGAGCQLSALAAAFLAASPGASLEAAAAAVCAMGLAGEIALARQAPGDGNATLRCRIIDAVYHMDGHTLNKGARYEIR